MTIKTKIFSNGRTIELEDEVNKWAAKNNVNIHSQQITYNPDMQNYVMSILYNDLDGAPVQLNS